MKTQLAEVKVIKDVSLNRRNILVIDDDAATLTAIKTSLEERQFNVFTATCGTKAFHILEQMPIQLLLIDVCIPIMDGFAICEKIRQLPRYQRVPIYMLTGLTDTASIERAFASGANDYIAKPIDLRILSRRLEVIFDKSESDAVQGANQALRFALAEAHDFVIDIDPTQQLILRPQYRLPAPLLSVLNNCLSLPALCAVANPSASKPAQIHSTFKSREFWLSGIRANLPYRYQLKVIQLASGQHYLAIDDNSKQVTDEHGAYYDTRTQLPNERLLGQTLSHLDQGPTANLARFGIAVLCFTNLRKVENIIGKERTLLQLLRLIDILKGCVSNNGLKRQVFRGGYDEVFVTFSDCRWNQFVRELEKLNGTLRKEAGSCLLQTTLGACHGVQVKDSAQCIKAHAEMAAEIDGELHGETSHRLQFYRGDMRDTLQKRSEMERLLHRDISTLSMEVHFQPKFHARSLSLTGIEALLRWHSKELGPVSPGEFIPIAESTNLMKPLSQMVVEKTFEQIKCWLSQGRKLVPVSINLDASNLADDTFVNALIVKCTNMAISPNLIEVEITENLVVHSDSAAVKNLHRLREAGIRIAIDDFGTGYSSLRYLKDLPVDSLKIDMSFVRQIACDTKAEAIIRAIIMVGHDMGLDVVAEGVEDKTQLSKLAALGCDTIQGFLTGKPVNALSFSDYFSGPSLVQ